MLACAAAIAVILAGMEITGLGCCGTRTDRSGQLAHFCEHVLGLRLVHRGTGFWVFKLPNGRPAKAMNRKIFRSPGLPFVTTPSPAEAVCIVAFHLPFDSGLELWREADLPLIECSADQEFQVSDIKIATAGLYQLASDDVDLILQQYSAKEGARLLSRLPHRIWEESLMDATRGKPQTTRPFSAQGIAWSLMDARASIWSGGAGLLTVEYALDIPRHLTWAQVSQFIDCAQSEMKDISAWSEGAGGAIRRARKVLIDSGYRFPMEARDDVNPTLTWCHATISVAVGNCTSRNARTIANTIVWNGVKCDLGNEAPNTVIEVALSACSVTYTKSSVSEITEEAVKVRHALVRMVGVITSVWRTLQSCDDIVLEMIGGWQTGRRMRLAQIEDRLDALLGIYQSMQGITGALESVHIHLSSLDGPLWHTLTEKWGLKQLMDSLDTHLKLLQDLYSNAATAANARRTRWFGNFAFLFTLLSAVSTGLALTQFLAPHQSGVSRVVTTLVCCVFVITSWLVFWTWQRGRLMGARGMREYKR